MSRHLEFEPISSLEAWAGEVCPLWNSVPVPTLRPLSFTERSWLARDWRRNWGKW